MDIKNYKVRIIDKKIKLYLETFGALLIEGPKWCGKTWTSLNSSQSSFFLADSKGNFNNKKIASMDPEIILNGLKPRLIDEWQEVPSIWDAVRNKVDFENIKGQFILTGSTSINRNTYIHSGTGRIARLKMRPMSLYESSKSKGLISLKDICDNKAPNLLTGEVKLEDIVDYILIGGWPSSIDADLNHGILVPKEYINSIINEDIFKIDNIKRDKHKVQLLLKSLARNESTTVTNSTLKKDIIEKEFDDINIDSISNYLNLFDNLHLIENIPPFSFNIRSPMRLKQSEKRHFVDPSLACALLSLTKEKLLNNIDFLGFLFESLVDRDLLTYVDAFNAKLYHYQDYKNNEIDAIIELKNGDWCGIEIKLGANKIDEAAKNLLKINNAIIKEGGIGAKSLCVICGLTNAAYKRDDGVYVVPITALKD